MGESIDQIGEAGKTTFLFQRIMKANYPILSFHAIAESVLDEY